MPFDGKATDTRLTKDLVKARDLILDPLAWCPGITHQVRRGRMQRCALGAVMDATGGCCTGVDRYDAVVEYLGQFATYRGKDKSHGNVVFEHSPAATKICGHNNSLGHAATIEMFNQAIVCSRELAR